MKFPSFKTEVALLANGYDYVIGCDEVGVAPLAGPVVAAACVLDPKSISKYRTKSKWYFRVRDSKTTNEKERQTLVQEIKKHCLAFGIGQIQPSVIDQINIHQASLEAKCLAIKNLLVNLKARVKKSPRAKLFLLIDGQFTLKNIPRVFEQQAVIRGDASILSISAASIIAKVYRDQVLKTFDAKYPEYGFARHKGYSTKQHRAAIAKYGITELHRKSFLKSYKI